MLSIIIPAFNEQDNLCPVVSEIVECCKELKYSDLEIILVNDGSSDNTQSVAEGLVKQYPFVRLLTHMNNLGLGQANLSGFLAAKGEWVTWFPGDGDFVPFDMLHLIKQNACADMVVGHIQLRQRLKNDGLLRIIMSKGWRLMIRMLLGHTPGTGVLYAFRRSLLNEVALVSSTGLLNIEFPMKVSRRGYKIARGQISVRPRLSGNSKVANTRTIIKVAWEILKLRMHG